MPNKIDDFKDKSRNFFKRFLLVSLIGLILFCIGYYFFRTHTISEGTRTGIIYKVSKKGVFLKTYEGQMQLAGSAIMNKTSTWEFSILDEKVYHVLQEHEGKNVRLTYKQLVNAFPWQGDTDYIVTKAELFEE